MRAISRRRTAQQSSGRWQQTPGCGQRHALAALAALATLATLAAAATFSAAFPAAALAGGRGRGIVAERAWLELGLGLLIGSGPGPGLGSRLGLGSGSGLGLGSGSGLGFRLGSQSTPSSGARLMTSTISAPR